MNSDRRTFLAQSLALLALGVSPAHAAAGSSNFREIYGDILLRDRFFLFLQNVFHLYPQARFHQLIIDLCATLDTDEAIYRALLDQLPGIATTGSMLTYALPALNKQKREMARQAAGLLDGVTQIDGYLEVGSTGRYVAGIEAHAPIHGPTYLLNDLAPTNSPADIMERGQLGRNAVFLPLGAYDPIAVSDIADASLDLITNFIGFHHCPEGQRDGFIDTLRRVLRPGGRLLVREHDVADPTMDTFVALAHDVFNAGVRLSWSDNAAQIRNFRSVDGWSTLLESRGFKRASPSFLQAHDPTDNVLMAFVKV